MRLAFCLGALALGSFALLCCSLLSGGEGVPTEDGGGPDIAADQSGCSTGKPDMCSGQCVDLKSDVKNCGQCGNDCSMGGAKPLTACTNAMCIECDPMKVDFQTDPNHCGRCGHSCLGGGCATGTCQKQLLSNISSPLAIAVDSEYVYFTAFDLNVYALAKSADAGTTPVVLTTTTGYSYDVAPFPGGAGLAHTNGATLAYFDGGAKVVDFYYGQYGAAVQNGVFWWTTSFAPSTVKSVNVDGTSGQTAFVDVAAGAQGLAVQGTTAYWTNVTTKNVMRGDPDASPVVVASIVAPRAVLGSYRIVAVGNDVVWTEPSTTDPSADGRVMRAVGGKPDAAVKPIATGLGNPQYIAYDGTDLFWTNRGSGTVSRIKGDGSEPMPKTIVSNAPDAYGVAVDAKFVYFTQSRTTATGGGVYRVAK